MSFDSIILDNFGGVAANDLIPILYNDSDVIEEKIRVRSSSYYSHDNFEEILTCNRTKFSILYLNCQSINAKFNKLQILLDNLKKKQFEFSAICLQETWLANDDDLSLLQLPNYQCIHKGKSCSMHGGLIIYLNNKYNYSIHIKPDVSEIWQGLFIKIQNPDNDKTFEIGNIYRPPKDNNSNTNVSQFIKEISPILQQMTNSNAHSILVGDFNIDLLKVQEKNHFSDYLENLLSYGFHPTITFPTRFSDRSASLIDNIFSNNMLNISISGILFSNISDHLPYFCCTEPFINHTSKQIFTYNRKINQESITLLQNHLHALNILNILKTRTPYTPNDLYITFENIINEAINVFMSLRKVKYNKYKHKKTKWISFGIIKSIKYRDNLYKLLKSTPQNSVEYPIRKQNLNVYNKLLKKLIHTAKENYYGREFEKYKTSTKKTWNTINEIINKCKHETLPDQFVINGDSITNKSVIAENFNHHFATIGSDLASSIENVENITNDHYLRGNIHSEFQFHQIDIEMVENTIQNLNSTKSTGYDGLSIDLIKQIGHIIAEPLSFIINCSLALSIFPEKLKIAKIIPIYKKGDKHQIENYRPISILPVISKVFEKVAYNQLFEYFSQNKLLFDSQYGFRKFHSTEHAVLELLEKLILNIDKGQMPVAVFLDLSKAFNTLDHQILLHKLKYYGIQESALNWIHSYLYNRSQYVEVDSRIKSEKVTLNIGVPQGSILGPLLFIIYTNDLHNSTKYFKFILYADDTTLFNPLCNYNYDNDCLQINNELNKIFEWLCVNKLSLNVKKTQFMIFHSTKRSIQKKPDLFINNIPIEHTDEFNFLGITINSVLDWKPHINKISIKISRAIGIMNKLKKILPSYILKTIYDSLIQCHINYGILAWGYYTNNIFKLQKKSNENHSKNQVQCSHRPNIQRFKSIKNYGLI